MVAGIAVCLLAGCDPLDWNDPHRGSPTFNGEMRAQDPDTCVAQGGDWTKVCMAQDDACVTPYPDGGKACDDGAHCAGDCLAEGNGEGAGPVTGVCQRDDNPCGIFTRINDGVEEIGIAVD
jgi:hypothetical protein